MGSFNASCAVSHCGINPGDQVKLIAIVSNTAIFGDPSEMHNGFACYCHDNFSIIGYPMDATYEDYGNFEVKKDMFSEYNLSIIRNNYTKNTPPEGDDEISSVAESRNGYSLEADDLTWDQISEMIHYGNMYLDSNEEKTQRRYMGFFPVHKCVYDLLLKRTPEMYFDSHCDNVPFHKFLERHVTKHPANAVDEFFEESLTKYMKLFGPLIGHELTDGTIMTPEIAHAQATDMAELDAEFKSSSSSSYCEYSYNNTTNIKTFTKYRRDGKLPSLTDDEHAQLVRVDAECTYFIRGLNDLQIQIIPPMTAGQVYDKTEHAAFMLATAKALLSLQNSAIEDEDEDVDEYVSPFQVVANPEIHISLNILRQEATSDWRPERGKLKLDAIDKFVLQYPNGATLSADEVISQGYADMIVTLPSTILPLVFKNDIKE